MITSASNERIKAIRKLRDRKYRETSSKYFIEGTRIVYEAMQAHQTIDSMVFSEELIKNPVDRELIDQAERLGIELIEVSKDVYLSISLKEGAQAISAVCHQNWKELDAVTEGGVWIGLLEVADPGNLGTIIRTADATGAKGIILIDHCTDPYDPSATRASMGGIYSLSLVKTTTHQFIDSLTGRLPIIGTSDAASMDYHDVDYSQDMILLMGSERQGLSPQLKSACDLLVSIQMVGKCDSLNLAVSTGIILYEILNQHRNSVVRT